MRIGIDTRLQNETGVGRYIRNLIHYLPEFDHKNEYVFINPPVAWHSIKEQIKMPQVIQTYNIDLMHFPYFNVPIFYSKPFVVTIHDLIINNQNTGRASNQNLFVYNIKRLGYLYAMRHAVHRSKAIIVPSGTTKNMLVSLYKNISKDKIFVTYEGVDHKIKSLNGKVVKNSSIKNLIDTSFFLYVGNAYPHKNVEFLIQSFTKLKDKNFKLVLVGKMNYFYYRVHQLVENLKLSDRVILTGEISDACLSWLYQHAASTVIPSKMEGFGLPVLEAMHHECLVLASNIDAFKEVAGDVPVYFNHEDVNDLTSKLNAVAACGQEISNKQRLQNGAIRASKFSWKKMTKETIQVYERCISL